jgi:hypothetical protein
MAMGVRPETPKPVTLIESITGARLLGGAGAAGVTGGVGAVGTGDFAESEHAIVTAAMRMVSDRTSRNEAPRKCGHGISSSLTSAVNKEELR